MYIYVCVCMRKQTAMFEAERDLIFNLIYNNY